KALALDPNLSEASINLAMAYLVSGRFLEGWGHYESRQAKKSFSEGIHQPQWMGEDFQGKTLLVRAEQGYGDTLQFIRYLPWVKSLGGQVILECHPGLTQLLLGVDGVDMLIEHTSDLSPPQVDYDLFIPMMSLPFLHQTTLESIPAVHPYLHIPQQHQEDWLKKANALAHCGGEKELNASQDLNLTSSQEAGSPINPLKIGIAWAGNLSNKNGRHRACPLENFYPLLELPHAQIYSLQKDPPDFRDPHCTTHQVWAEEELRDYNIIPLGSHLTNFYETAGAISQLDLVVTVDTSIAHLAGALGKPVWVILPAVPDWRWMMSRSDTPWYPTMRLFRQPNPGNWAAVFQEILEALEASNTF
ncbi:MAG: hypothetical protein K2X66_02845, partial [Cyanobacteria bacterium]|nr:hypothetical protein [Cyanobacteriota bacterium]